MGNVIRQIRLRAKAMFRFEWILKAPGKFGELGPRRFIALVHSRLASRGLTLFYFPLGYRETPAPPNPEVSIGICRSVEDFRQLSGELRAAYGADYLRQGERALRDDNEFFVAAYLGASLAGGIWLRYPAAMRYLVDLDDGDAYLYQAGGA